MGELGEGGTRDHLPFRPPPETTDRTWEGGRRGGGGTRDLYAETYRQLINTSVRSYLVRETYVVPAEMLRVISHRYLYGF